MSPEYEPVPPNPEFAVLLDVDRTVLKSEAFSGYAYQVLEQMGISPQIIDQVQHEQSQQRGNAFDYLPRVFELANDKGAMPNFSYGTIGAIEAYLERMFMQDDAQLRRFRASILVEGTEELVDQLEHANMATILCTSGGEVTQRLKLNVLRKVLNVDPPWIIVGTDQQQKAARLAEYYDHDEQRFNFAAYARHGIAAHRLAGDQRLANIKGAYVVDDKWVNISEIPEGIPVTGILVQTAELGDVATSDRTRVSLSEALEQLTGSSPVA